MLLDLIPRSVEVARGWLVLYKVARPVIPVDRTESHMLQAVRGGYGEEGGWGEVYDGTVAADGGGGGGGGGMTSPSPSSALRPPASPNLRPGAYEFKPSPH